MLFFHSVLQRKPKEELSIFYEKSINPLIYSHNNFEEVYKNLKVFLENPELIKTENYNEILEECCDLFTDGIQSSIEEILLGNSFKTKDKLSQNEKKSHYSTNKHKLEAVEKLFLNKCCPNLFSTEENKTNTFVRHFQNQDKVYPFEEEIQIVKCHEFCDGACYDTKNKSEETTSRSSSEKKAKIQLSNRVQLIKKEKLRKFQFKFTKRENIDKKVLRKFRKFLRDSFKHKQREILHKVLLNKFWFDFINLNLLPPFTYLPEEKNFKSFNTDYMCWIFDHNESSELYHLFLQSQFANLLIHFETKFHLKNDAESLSSLKTYILAIPSIFILSSKKEPSVCEASDIIFEGSLAQHIEEKNEEEKEISLIPYDNNYSQTSFLECMNLSKLK